MRRFVIDTDTASDDAVALIMALREPSLRVEAITVVAGNVPLDRAVKNALISVEVAATYQPPVYRGMHKPLLRKLFTAEFVHGEDGMGNMNLPDPKTPHASGHAVDALIQYFTGSPGELELITLGPLTNIAMACLKEPRFAESVKAAYVMGSAGFGPGNITPVAEFNMYVDAEAASIVFDSGMPLTVIGWDISMSECLLDQQDLARFASTDSPAARFALRCNQRLRQFNMERFGRDVLDLPDPTAVAVAIHPDRAELVEVRADVETRSGQTYGQLILDERALSGKPRNARACRRLDARRFKQLLFDRLA
jgi:purine nucleosidase